MRIYSYNEWRTYGVIVDWRLREYDRSIAVLQVVVALPIPSNINKYIYTYVGKNPRRNETPSSSSTVPLRLAFLDSCPSNGQSAVNQ